MPDFYRPVHELLAARGTVRSADAGFVDRAVLEGPPVGVRYQLAARGEDLRGVFAELEAWAERHLLDVVVGGGVAPRCVIRTVLAS